MIIANWNALSPFKHFSLQQTVLGKRVFSYRVGDNRTMVELMKSTKQSGYTRIAIYESILIREW